MAIVIGDITRQFSAGEKTQCTVTVPIVNDATQEVVETITHSEPYVEGEAAEITVKRFVGELQQKIDACMKKRTLDTADEDRDAFLPLLKNALKLGVK